MVLLQRQVISFSLTTHRYVDDKERKKDDFVIVPTS